MYRTVPSKTHGIHVPVGAIGPHGIQKANVEENRSNIRVGYSFLIRVALHLRSDISE